MSGTLGPAADRRPAARRRDVLVELTTASAKQGIGFGCCGAGGHVVAPDGHGDQADVPAVGGDERLGRRRLGRGGVGTPPAVCGKASGHPTVSMIEVVVAPAHPKLTSVRCVFCATYRCSRACAQTRLIAHRVGVAERHVVGAVPPCWPAAIAAAARAVAAASAVEGQQRRTNARWRRTAHSQRRAHANGVSNARRSLPHASHSSHDPGQDLWRGRRPRTRAASSGSSPGMPRRSEAVLPRSTSADSVRCRSLHPS